MALVPVDHRYVVEGGRLIHYVALQDPDTGRETTQALDEGMAPPGAQEGPLDETPSPSGLDTGGTPDLSGSDLGGPPPVQGVDSRSMYGGFGSSMFPGTPGMYQFGNISGGGGADLGSGFMKPQNYNFGDISAGIGPRGGDMASPTSLNPQAAQLEQMRLMQGQPAPPPPAAASAAGATNGVTGTPGQDWQNFGNLARFNPENPQMAMVQKMMDMGMQPFNKLNPFMGMLQRAAAGLAASFMVNQANNPANVMGAGSAPPDPSKMFSDFLGSALGSGSVLATAQSGLGGIGKALDAYRAQQAAGGPQNATQINPFLGALIDLMTANQGEGATSLLSAMQSPLMPRGLAKSYDEGLNQTLAGANRNFWSQPAPAPGQQPGQDFMKFLMGM